MDKLTVAMPPKPDPDSPDTDVWRMTDNPFFEAYTNHGSNDSLSKQKPAATSPSTSDVPSTDTSKTASSITQDKVTKETLPEEVAKEVAKDVQVIPRTMPDSESDEDIFECGICTDDLSKPKSLPCLHNFCLDCLEKYFRVNNLKDDSTFSCPTCRASVTIPKGGATNFPTNFHIVNLRKRSRDLDLGQTIKDAVTYLETRAEEIVDELTETKRLALVDISRQREVVMATVDITIETLQDTLEEQYDQDATRAVDTISAIKSKLSDLQDQLGSTCNLATETTGAIRLNALTKLRRQAEIITSVHSELEGLKAEADRSLGNILESSPTFRPGSVDRDGVRRLVGRLGGEDCTEEGFSPLHVRSWSQSWWVTLFAVLPAILCAMVIKVIMTLFEKLLD